MEITRNDLIELCDKFLNGEIQKEEIEIFALNALSSDEADWDDEIISETILEWDNEDNNFPINIVNMQLWKKRLKDDKDELLK